MIFRDSFKDVSPIQNLDKKVISIDVCEQILSSDEESARNKTLNKKKDTISDRVKSDKNLLPAKNDINGIGDVSVQSMSCNMAIL